MSTTTAPRRTAVLATAALLCAAAPASAFASASTSSFVSRSASDPSSASTRGLPTTLHLPRGFQPEGISTVGGRFYVGSLRTGAVYGGDLRTGRGALVVPEQRGRQAVGLKVDGRGRAFVAGGPGGLYVYDTRSGATLAAPHVGSGGLVNDVALTASGAFFTDSFAAHLYEIPTGRAGRLGRLRTIELSGDLALAPAGPNINGITPAQDGRHLIAVQDNLGKLFDIDPVSGRTREIPLAGGSVQHGDGILRLGGTLYVSQNELEQISVIQLSRDGRAGRVVRTIRDPRFETPTTLGSFGGGLYVVNSRITVKNGMPSWPGPTAAYDVLRLPFATRG